MKILKLEQGTREWLDFRDKGIGASDAPIIMGLSKYCTPGLLYKRKKGLEPPAKITEAMKKGSCLEPIIRIDAEDYYNIKLDPCVVQHDEYPFLFASLDGANFNEKFLVEIKCSNKIYEEAKNGIVDKMYYCQIQHQLMVTGFDNCCYFVSDEGLEFVALQVKRDDEYIENMLPHLLEFYRCLSENEPPFEEDAYMTVEIDDEKNKLIDKWVEAQKKLREIQKEEKFYADSIKELGDGLNCELMFEGNARLRMTRVQRTGSVDWKALCVVKQISEIDIEPFRKKEIGYYQLTEIKS